MTALLYHNLSWFRRLGISAAALKTLVKDYPNTERGVKFSLTDNDTIRDAMGDGKDFTVKVPS